MRTETPLRLRNRACAQPSNAAAGRWVWHLHPATYVAFAMHCYIIRRLNNKQLVRMPCPFPRAWRCMALALLATLLAGCATSRDPRDPLEPINRGVYQFNEALDRVALKPAAKGYRAAVPLPVRGGINNVFSNFQDVTTAINDLLQGKVSAAASDVGRIAVNSTIGLFGIFDVATRLGLEKRNEDFGQTFGVWGVNTGPYIVLPLLGPSTARDAVGLGLAYFTDPEFYLVTHSPETWIVFGVRVVNVRSNLLDSERIFDAAAVDKYAFLRDAYLQRRRSLIYDGNPPSDSPGSVRRKTFKEMEEELDLDEPAAPPAPNPVQP
jgi:phospholipid-binding lipoprotein MlaA